MPLFALLSGYLFYYSLNRNFFDLIKRKFETIVIPTTAWGIISIIVFGYFKYKNTDININIDFFKFCINHIRSLWFLWGIVFSVAIASIVEKKFTNVALKLSIYLGTLFFFTVFPHMKPFDLYTYIYPYFVLGLYFNYFKKDKQLRISPWFILVLITIFLMQYHFFTYEDYVYTSGINTSIFDLHQLKINLERWLVGLNGSILCLYLLWWIYNNIGRGRVSGAFSFLGTISIGIYAFNNYQSNILIYIQ